MIVFIKSFKGQAKETNKDFQALTLAQLSLDKDGYLVAQVKEFFVDVRMNCNCEFGDIVQVEWSEDGFGGARKPIKIGVVGERPFKEMITDDLK